MQRHDIEQRLLQGHRDLPAGVVLAAVGRAARRFTRSSRPGTAPHWPEIELAAEEQLLLRRAMRAAPGAVRIVDHRDG